MSLPVDIVSLVLYCIQQLGVVLGVGAQTILLISFIIATRDGIVEEKEAQFGRAVIKVLTWGLLLMIGSGIAITAMHIAFGELEIVFTPAYVFKWALIGVISAITYFAGRQPYMHFFWEGMLGAQWYALFIVHVVAPLIAWVDLLVLYGLWTVGFILAWVSIVYSMRGKREKAQAPADPAEKRSSVLLYSPKPDSQARPFSQQAPPPPPPVPKPVPPPAPKPTPPPPKPAPPPSPKVSVPVPHKLEELPPHVEMPKKPEPPKISIPPKPVAKVPEKPIEDPDKNPGLPTIRVMPKTEQDLDTQMRASSVQFGE